MTPQSRTVVKRIWIVSLILLSFSLGACRADVEPPQPIGIAAPEVIQASLASVEAEDSMHLFDYDPDLPLDIIEVNRWQEDGQTWIDFTYASPMGGRVPARLVIPPGEGPFPAIMIQHGSLGHITSHEWTARIFTSLGAVVILIEDPYSRPGGWQTTEYMGSTWPYYTAQDLEVKIQSIIDMRRAVDILLQRPDVDPERLAYYGFSYGAAMGGLLSGVEDRFQAYVLQVGDGGLVEHTSDPGPDGLPIHFSSTWVELMWPTEPLHFVGRASDAPILFLNGLHDINVPADDALRFQAAASEPKAAYWYDADHHLPPQAVYDAAEWLQPYLGTQLLWLAPDYHPWAVILDWGMTLWVAATLISLFALWRWSRRDSFSLRYGVLWMLTVLFIGPLGLMVYSWAQRTTSGNHFALVSATSINVTALTSAILLGNLANNAFAVDQPMLGLLLMYLIFMFASRLIHRLAWRTSPSSRLAHVLTAHTYWAVGLIASVWVNRWLSVTTIIDARVLWSLGLAYVLGVLVNLPIYAWLLNRGLARWIPEGFPLDENVSFTQLHWTASAGLGLTSFLLAIGSLIWLIAYSTGLSLPEIVQALQSSG
jgi:dienelactone hydrolase